MNLYIKGTDIDLGFPNPEIENTASVYVGEIILGEKEIETLGLKSNRTLYIFAASVKLIEEIRFVKQEVKRLKFIVLDKILETGEIREHHLAQHSTVMYKCEQDKTGSQCVDMLKKKDIRYLHKLPVWKASEANIPQIDNQLFYFGRQFYFPTNKVTKEYLYGGETSYVFLHGKDEDELLIQIYTQDMSLQTAEDHYRLEAMIAEYEANYNNLEMVTKLIKKGDKYFHEYMLISKRTKRPTLEILLEYAKTKAIKTEVLKRLKDFK